MKDLIIKETGNSRSLKSSIGAISWEEARGLLQSGTFPIDLLGLNPDGVQQTGTALNKANLLSDTTKTALELTQSDPTVNDALYALSQKGSPAEVHVIADNGTTVTMSKSGKVLSAQASGGEAILYPTVLGDWQLTYTYGGQQKSKTFTLEVIGIVTVYPFNVSGSLESTDWTDIALCSQFGQAKNYFAIGDRKTVNIGGTNYQVQIIGFDHDDLTSGGKAGITFQMVDCLNATAQMNSSNTNSGGWNSSAMRSRMSTYLSQLPSALQSAIKTVSKKSGTGGGSSSGTQTTSDKLFLLSEIEIFGKTTYSVAGEGNQYEYYAAGNSTSKKVNGSANNWWERSPYSGNTSNFCNVGSDGNAYRNNANDSRGVSFGFCV